MGYLITYNYLSLQMAQNEVWNGTVEEWLEKEEGPHWPIRSNRILLNAVPLSKDIPGSPVKEGKRDLNVYHHPKKYIGGVQ